MERFGKKGETVITLTPAAEPDERLIHERFLSAYIPGSQGMNLVKITQELSNPLLRGSLYFI